METNNESTARILLSLGFEKPNCYKCQFFRKAPDHQHYGECTHAIADASRLVRQNKVDEGLIKESDTESYFPIVYCDTDEGEIAIPGVIAREFGINVGLVTWPISFDPIYIIFCALYAGIIEQIDNKLPIDRD